VFENTVLRRIFGSKRDRARREQIKQRNEEVNDLYCLSNIIRVIKPRTMRWAEHIANMGESRGAYRFWWGNMRERDHLEHSGVLGI
jgi:hypothetical protein